MAARHLGMSPESWDGLAWWQQQMYLDGYVWEGLIERQEGAESDPTGVVTGVHREGNTTITDRRHEQTLSLVPGEFGAFGIPEQTMG